MLILFQTPKLRFQDSPYKNFKNKNQKLFQRNSNSLLYKFAICTYFSYAASVLK